MDELVIFDEFIEEESLILSLSSPTSKLHICPLSSRADLLEKLLNYLNEKGHPNEVIHMGEILNSVAENLRPQYIEFIAELPFKTAKNGKDLRKLFKIDQNASLWWFSLIAEKNTYKSKVWNNFATLNSVIGVINDKNIKKIHIGINNDDIRLSLRKYCDANGIRIVVLPVRSEIGLRDVLLKVLNKNLIVYQLISLLRFVIQTIMRTRKIKKQMKGYIRKKDLNNALACITYYPFLNVDLAKEGILEHRHYSGLQKALEKEKKEIYWILFYTWAHNISLNESIEYAKKALNKGENIFFIEEFITVPDIFRSIFRLIWMGIILKTNEKAINKAHYFGDYNFYDIFKKDWYSSFLGAVGLSGLIYYGLFGEMFKRLQIKKCYYYCEMHAWEKALISARNSLSRATSLYGYQSGTVSRMLLNYFPSSKEINDSRDYPMPKPDKLLCNGNNPYMLFKDSGWKDNEIEVVEAIRYEYLQKYFQIKPEKKRAVLIACSISVEESSSIIRIASEALKAFQDIEVWIRPHPSLNLDRILGKYGSSENSKRLILRKEPIDIVLSEARVVIAGETGVSVEALAFGCEIIIVNVPEWINMSPLNNYISESIHKIYSADELKAVISRIFNSQSYTIQKKEKLKKIVEDFFYFQRQSTDPERLLNILLKDKF
jgi:surface carbohydrate biosynthesis protein (TIGR04326 family)